MCCLQVLFSAVKERKNKHHPSKMGFSHDRPIQNYPAMDFGRKIATYVHQGDPATRGRHLLNLFAPWRDAKRNVTSVTSNILRNRVDTGSVPVVLQKLTQVSCNLGPRGDVRLASHRTVFQFGSHKRAEDAGLWTHRVDTLAGSSNVAPAPLGGAVALWSPSMMSSSDRLSYDTHPPLCVLRRTRLHTHARVIIGFQLKWLKQYRCLTSTRNRKHVDFMFW